jgi:hypothetical protein
MPPFFTHRPTAIIQTDFLLQNAEYGLAGLERSRIVSMEKFDLEAECDFRGLPPKEIETACLYEYMRESQTLRDALNAATEEERREKESELVTRFFLSFTAEQFVGLMCLLQQAGFPKPWKRLSKPSQRQLVLLLAGYTKRTLGKDKELYPPVIVEEGAPEFDPSENCWRVGQLEPFELNLFKGWERECFFGFIRIDCGYNEDEVVEAFRKDFRKRRKTTTKGGNRERWRAKLNNLVVMRIWKHESNQWERLKQVAEFCAYEDCKEEMKEYEERRKRGHGGEPMMSAAKAEMSRARKKARSYFQRLFPDQEPLSWKRAGKGES